MKLILRSLEVDDEAQVRAGVEAMGDEFEFAFQYEPSEPFPEYVERVNLWPQGIGLPDRFVPNTFLVGVVEDTIVGRISIRHELNDFLRKVGGHIGYCVLPSFRRQGFATRMLENAVNYGQYQLGIDELLVTCDDDNAASKGVIEKVGGRFESTYSDPSLRRPKLRYWFYRTR